MGTESDLQVCHGQPPQHACLADCPQRHKPVMHVQAELPFRRMEQMLYRGTPAAMGILERGVLYHFCPDK